MMLVWRASMEIKLESWLRHKFIVVLCSWLYLISQTIQPVRGTDFFIREPTSLLLPVESDGIFECRTIQNTTLQWTITVGGESYGLNSPASQQLLNNKGIRELEKNGSTYSKVLVEGLLDNNNTALTCEAFGMNVLKRSKEATLQLYGPPDPPVNIHVTVGPEMSLLVSWEPPFFPFIENVSLNYTLYILKDHGYSLTIKDIEYHNTSYLFATDALETCQNISFILQSVNAAGVGRNSSTITRAVPEIPKAIASNIQTEVDLNEGSIPSVKLIFKSPSVCPDYPVLSYSINLTDITVSDGIMYANESTMDNITMGGSDEGEVALLIEEGLDPDRIYRVSVTAVNEVGKSTGSREVEFRTTDLQNLTVTYDQERYITIRCEFARGSQARGCHITVKTLTDRELISVNVTRNRTEDTAVKEFDVSMLGRLNISKLVVVGFDLEADGTIGEVSSIPLINLVKSTDEPSVSGSTSSVLVSMTTVLSSSTQPTPTVVRISHPESPPLSTPLIIGISVVGLVVVVGVVTAVLIIAVQMCTRRNRGKEELGVVTTDGNSDVVDFVQANFIITDSVRTEVGSNSDSQDERYVPVDFLQVGSDPPSDESKSSLEKGKGASPDLSNQSRSSPVKILESSFDLLQQSASGSDQKLVQPYGVTTLSHPAAVRPPEHVYQSLNEVKMSLSDQKCASPVLQASSSERSDSPPPPLSFKTHPIHSSSHSVEPFYHVLEQNSSCSQGSSSPQLLPPPLYDEVSRERTQSSAGDSHNSHSTLEGGFEPSSSPISVSTTPSLKKERVYHVLERNPSQASVSEINGRESFTVSQSTCNSQSGVLGSQVTLSTVCSCRDNDVFDETDGFTRQFGGSRPTFGRQQTIDQAMIKSRSLPVGSRLAVRGRCNSEPNNQAFGIVPYNTLERRMQGSYTLKRTLV